MKEGKKYRGSKRIAGGGGKKGSKRREEVVKLFKIIIYLILGLGSIYIQLFAKIITLQSISLL